MASLHRHQMASTSSGSYSVKPLPRVKSHRLMNHVLDELRLCSLEDIRENGRELYTAMQTYTEHLKECIDAYQHTQSPVEIARLRQDIVNTDQKIVYILIQAVEAIRSQCDQILHDSRTGADCTAESHIRLDNAMTDKAKLKSLQSWLSDQVGQRGALANQRPKTPTLSNPRITRIASHKRNHPQGERQYDQTGRTQHHLLPNGHPVGIYTAILRASGRHPTRPALNHQLNEVLHPKRIQKHTRDRKKPKSSLADRQNQVVQRIVSWWKARDEMEVARKKTEEAKEEEDPMAVEEDGGARAGWAVDGQERVVQV